MKLYEFLLHKTQVAELCVIRDSGWIVATCWIDEEDLFRILPSISEREIKGDKWGYLPIVNENGAEITVPCHYIDI
jgi:hypothetical protein